MTTSVAVPARTRVQEWEYLVVPLEEAKGLNYGDLVAWPVVLLKRPVG